MSNPLFLELTGNMIDGNRALNYSDENVTGQGGGLYYTCSLYFRCEIAILNENSFFTNFAEDAGGAIKWAVLEPTFDGTTVFKDNLAFLYGNDIASVAQQIILLETSQAGRMLSSVAGNSETLSNI